MKDVVQSLEDAPVEHLVETYRQLITGQAQGAMANSRGYRCYLASLIVQKLPGPPCHCRFCRDLRKRARQWEAFVRAHPDQEGT